MESPPRWKFTVIFSIIISLSLGLVSFILCITSEIKRNKKEDLRWNGKLCYLPSSQAFGLGIAALVSFILAQIIGNCILFKNSCSGRKRNAQYKIPVLAKLLLLISWLSFGIAVILLITATSMSKMQPYGVGWLNGECYLVKRGTYAGSAILVIVTVGSVIGSALSTIKTNQAEQGRKIHAQKG
ncbi:protein MODIFYING WALL LIGNIN-2-like [Gastrolobium bilobum]|uniref:protein MODIFYING WALL LIGNIN-2-like n=1 Tax=Gastrolobium bilobum TaxID=150636 RepID=UPI002AAF7810|nr:protein MODIFYING WALL LIGNIN-2-like [Gastrolobium bilobum]